MIDVMDIGCIGSQQLAGDPDPGGGNDPPVVQDIDVTGSLIQGSVLTISALIENTSAYPTGGELKVYSGESASDPSPELIATVTDYTIVAGRVEFEYLIQIEDIGNHFIFGVIPLLIGTLDHNVGDEVQTPYTAQVVPAVSAMDVFTEWRFEFVEGSLINWGVANDAIPGVSIPLWEPDPLRYNFTKASSQSLRLPISAAWNEPTEVWIVFQMKNITGTQVILGMDGADFIQVFGGQWNVSGINLGAADTDLHVLRIVFNGASSKFQLDEGSETTFNSSGDALATTQIRLGASSVDTNFADMYIHKAYARRGSVLSGGQVTAAYDFLDNFLPEPEVPPVPGDMIRSVHIGEAYGGYQFNFIQYLADAPVNVWVNSFHGSGNGGPADGSLITKVEDVLYQKKAKAGDDFPFNILAPQALKTPAMSVPSFTNVVFGSIAYLQSLGATKIFMMGLSQGGLKVLDYLWNDIANDLIVGIAAFAGKKSAGQLYLDAIDVPVYLIHGTADTQIPYNESVKVYNGLTGVVGRVSPTELKTIEGGNHSSSWQAAENYTTNPYGIELYDLVLDKLDL